MQVDPKFKTARARARGRRLRKLLQRALLWVLLPGMVLGSALWSFTELPTRLAEVVDGWRVARDDGEVLVQVEQQIVVAPVVRGNAFLNIPGDPTVLRLPPEDAGETTRKLAGPGVLDVTRFGLPGPDRLSILRDRLVVTESRLMTTLPSSREEFAFLQAEQDAASRALRAALSDPAALAELAGLDLPRAVETTADAEDSYGSVIDGVTAPAPPASAPEIVEETSLSFTRREASRQRLYEDVVLRAEQPRSLDALLRESPLASQAPQIAKTVAGLIPGSDQLPRGALVALRLRSRGAAMDLSHLSIYGAAGHMGTVGQTARGLAPASEPWERASLMAFTGGDTPSSGETFRLLDAIYSAALRGGVPSDLAGTFTGILAQDLDLDAAAQEGDQITLAFADAHGPNGTAEGQLMYAALTGPSGSWKCYVIPDRTNGGFGCHVPGRARQAGAVLTAPVDGVMTSRFGPRKHPILGGVRLHAGVDWAAPTGTPVRAAAAGRVLRRGQAGGYGNLLVLAHGDGLETRYAHLHRFAPRLAVGDVVQAGQIIGEVGTTGRSTGPHLHFEARLAGEPTDPLPLLTGAQVLVARAGPSPDASGAVEALVAQIIKVESAGNARAKNPRSTATGLGQFIDSTWLRMMNTYRPDLARSLSRRDLLALRFDPTLSREMVTRLAQENETFLRARGHGITPGRLYLAHFLGPGGADKVLSAPQDQTVLSLMGASVVRANPFLRNYDVADLRAWADRKMGRVQRGSTPTVANLEPAPPAPLDPATALFVELVDQIVAAPS